MPTLMWALMCDADLSPYVGPYEGRPLWGPLHEAPTSVLMWALIRGASTDYMTHRRWHVGPCAGNCQLADSSGLFAREASFAPQSERRPGVLGREHGPYVGPHVRHRFQPNMWALTRAGPYVGPYMERPCRSLCGPLDEELSLTILHTEGGPYVGPCMKHLSSPHTGARIPSTAAGPYVGSYARHIPRPLWGALKPGANACP